MTKREFYVLIEKGRMVTSRGICISREVMSYVISVYEQGPGKGDVQAVG